MLFLGCHWKTKVVKCTKLSNSVVMEIIFHKIQSRPKNNFPSCMHKVAYFPALIDILVHQQWTVSDYLAGTMNKYMIMQKRFFVHIIKFQNLLKGNITLIICKLDCGCFIIPVPHSEVSMTFSWLIYFTIFLVLQVRMDLLFFLTTKFKLSFACETSCSMFLDGMDVIRDHCSEEKDKHLSFPQSDTRLILGAWAHLLCLNGLLNNIQNSVGSA